MKYRLYVDEVGNHDLRSCHFPNQRYLSLTGVIVDLEYVRTNLHPEMEDLKCRHFDSHPDHPIQLHRKELASRLFPFHVLLEKDKELAWNEEFLSLLGSWEYQVITVTIDKLAHLNKYSVWHYHPYHYCLEVLIERYCRFLAKRKIHGDVMAEARGRQEDKRLKKAFTSVYEQGTRFYSANDIQRWLTSKELKLSEKRDNISGLQLSDLLAQPSFKLSVARHNNEPMPANFSGEIAQILLNGKYYRDGWGTLDGVGLKWLP